MAVLNNNVMLKSQGTSFGENILMFTQPRCRIARVPRDDPASLGGGDDVAIISH